MGVDPRGPAVALAPLPRLLHELLAVDRCEADAGIRWGGGVTVGTPTMVERPRWFRAKNTETPRDALRRYETL